MKTHPRNVVMTKYHTAKIIMAKMNIPIIKLLTIVDFVFIDTLFIYDCNTLYIVQFVADGK
jgi:hypothetical protein